VGSSSCVELDDVDKTRWPYRLPGPAGVSLAVDMQSFEAVLAERATALGATITRGRGIVDIEVSNSGVAVRTDQAPYYTRWLVGCDGGRSSVRKVAGFDFEGTAPEFTGYSIVA